MTVSALQRFDVALSAFRSGNFYKTIDELSHLLAGQPDNWEAMLYLAMAYYRVGNTAAAGGYFGYIRENSSDLQIKARADLAYKNTNLAAPGPQAVKAQPAKTQPAKPQLHLVPASKAKSDDDFEAEGLELVSTVDDYYRS